MWLYLIIFAIPLFAFLNGNAVNKNKMFLVYYTAFLALFVGMSDMLGGYDRYVYGEIFDYMADDITNGNPFYLSYGFQFYELGYSLLTYIIALISENRYIYILTVTLIIYFNLYKTFERHFKNYPFALIMFLGMVFFFTFTYLRQVIAFSFAWMSIKYLLEDKKRHFFVMSAIVVLLHKSGIVFFVLYFIPIKRWQPIKVWITLLLCGLVGVSGVTGELYDAVLGSGLVAEQGNEYNTDGSARIAYVIEVIFFVWIISKNYDKIESTRENLIFLNMAWAFCAILLLFIRSSDGGRVAWFFTMGIIYIICLVATQSDFVGNVKRRAGSQIATMMIVVMFALYFRIYNAWQAVMDLYPYKTFLTNGHRDGDPVFEGYEYDGGYDKDKFYRPAFRFLK